MSFCAGSSFLNSNAYDVSTVRYMYEKISERSEGAI